MRQDNLSPSPGSRRARKRVGRGNSSGHGTYSGRGVKGQKARSGGQIPAKFEGGQTPLVKRLPHKRGFKNPFRKEYVPINLDQLRRFPRGAEVNLERLVEAGLIKSPKQLVKILGQGDLSYALTVVAHRFSASAKAKIEAAGGKAVGLEA